MIGGGFQHDICSSGGSVPKYVEWVKRNHTAPISIHIDFGITSTPNPNKINYAWLAESKSIVGNVYQWVLGNINYIEENFELLFTHDKEIAKLSDKFKLVICNARPWVKDVGIHEKTKLVSMISSKKKMCTEHIYRNEIADTYKDRLDLFGRGYNEIPNKEIGLKDYHFSIAMENHTYSLAYSEKISDCFAMGTIPIYYGTPDIREVFNPDGIIMLEDFNIDELSPELYYSKMDAIKENYKIVIEMPTAEDYIYENYIK